MVDYNAVLYQHRPETWDAATCKKLASHTHKDGFGTRHHRKGYLGSSTSCPPRFGPVRYNGGCIRDGEWWQGENRPFPLLAEGYEIVHVRTWGWYLRAK